MLIFRHVIDRVYYNAPNAFMISDPVLGNRHFQHTAPHLSIWNPWWEKCLAFDEYKQVLRVGVSFVCRSL